MKILKGLAIFSVLLVLLGSCFDEPEFSIIPEIEFQNIEFVEAPGIGESDSLIIYLNFRDGDGDLGLSPEAIDSPYHSTNFWVNVDGNNVPVSTSPFSNTPGFVLKSTNKPPRFITYAIYYAPPEASKLYTLADRLNYGLPEFVPPYSTCTANERAYLTEKDTVYVGAGFKHVLDPSWIVDTLVDRTGNTVAYAALNKWYIEANPNHHNITVRFLAGPSVSELKEYDFREKLCTTYDGRFPVLADQTRPLEGTIRYSLVGTGFLSTFSINLMKLEIQVQDRSLNTSNTVDTGVFTLNNIRR